MGTGFHPGYGAVLLTFAATIIIGAIIGGIYGGRLVAKAGIWKVLIGVVIGGIFGAIAGPVILGSVLWFFSLFDIRPFTWFNY